MEGVARKRLPAHECLIEENNSGRCKRCKCFLRSGKPSEDEYCDPCKKALWNKKFYEDVPSYPAAKINKILSNKPIAGERAQKGIFLTFYIPESLNDHLLEIRNYFIKSKTKVKKGDIITRALCEYLFLKKGKRSEEIMFRDKLKSPAAYEGIKFINTTAFFQEKPFAILEKISAKNRSFKETKEICSKQDHIIEALMIFFDKNTPRDVIDLLKSL